MLSGVMDISSCCKGDHAWQCPEETCKKILSRKQTLITHVQCYHQELALKIGKTVTYKKYDYDSSMPLPRSTEYWRKRKLDSQSWPDLEQETDMRNPESICSDGYSVSQGYALHDMPSDDDACMGEEDMTISSEEENSDYENTQDTSDEESTQTSSSPTSSVDPNNDPSLYVIPPQESLYYSDITRSEHLLSVSAVATRHNLSSVAIADILALLQIHMPQANIGETSVPNLKEECGFGKSYLVYHLYCNGCNKLFVVNDNNCRTPGCPGATGNSGCKTYFVTSQLNVQLKEILERDGVWRSVCESLDLHKSVNISDIKSGQAYKNLQQPGNFLHQSSNITLSLFTDGIPLFKSSSVSLWPVYLLINELPPKERFQRKNMLLWGVWQGVGKPKMCMFLKPLIVDLVDIYHNGCGLHVNGEDILCKAMLVVATMDLQARAYVLNMTQHNGEYGCLYCLESGEVVPSGAGNCRSYPHRDTVLRTESGVRNSARIARTTSERVEGFFGENVLMYLPYFNVTESIVIDYMHGTLLGISKRFLDLWFSDKNSKEPWYIGGSMKVVDNLLLTIKPPSFIHRRPRVVTKTYKHWKASEIRNWLLFFSLPCLLDILPRVYLVHFSCLVEATYILLGEGITPADLARADVLLHTFYRNAAELYSPSIVGLNMHNLIHLTTCVKRWGPLWAWSCFPFESFNGEIKKSIHGTGNVCSEVFWSLQAQKRVEKKILSLPSLDSRAQQYMAKIVKSQARAADNESDAYQCATIQILNVSHPFDPVEKALLLSAAGTDLPEDFVTVKKIIRNGHVMYSKSCAKVKKQNSYTLLLEQPVNGAEVIEVEKYIMNKDSRKVFATGHLLAASGSILPHRVPHLQKLSELSPPVQVGLIKAENLREPLIIVPKGDDIYCAVLPNHFERD